MTTALFIIPLGICALLGIGLMIWMLKGYNPEDLDASDEKDDWRG